MLMTRTRGPMASCSNEKHVLSGRKFKNKEKNNNLVINQEVAIINVHRLFVIFMIWIAKKI